MARKLEACIVKAQAAGMSRQDAEELVDMMAGEKRRLAALAAQGKLDRAEVALADFARRTAKEAQINAALQRKHAALNVLRRRDVEGRLSALREQGVSEAEAVMAILGGSHTRVEGARASVSRALSGIRDRWLGGLSNELAQRPHVLELLSWTRSSWTTWCGRCTRSSPRVGPASRATRTRPLWPTFSPAMRNRPGSGSTRPGPSSASSRAGCRRPTMWAR
jgi:hypothetical protein